MKGNTLVLSMLLLISKAAFSMESTSMDSTPTQFVAELPDTTTAQDAATGLRARLGAACSLMESQISGVKRRVVSAKDEAVSLWQNRLGLSDVRNAITLKNIKNKVCNIPTTINNHRLATAIIVGVSTIAAVVACKLWRRHRAKLSPNNK